MDPRPVDKQCQGFEAQGEALSLENRRERSNALASSSRLVLWRGLQGCRRRGSLPLRACKERAVCLGTRAPGSRDLCAEAGQHLGAQR